MPQPIAIITGASQGLGLSLANKLCRAGYCVVGVHRGGSSEPLWRDLVDKKHAIEVLGSVSAGSTVEDAFAAAERAGSLDTVINCAGVGVFGPAGSNTRDAVDRVMEANLIGTILFCERAFLTFKDSGGTIVNIMSTAALVGRANESIYCAAKWGARGYTESLRAEAKGTKAKVVAIYPGGINTPFWDKQTGANTDATKFMRPDDVAATIIDNLTSNASLYVSDVTINRS